MSCLYLLLFLGVSPCARLAIIGDGALVGPVLRAATGPRRYSPAGVGAIGPVYLTGSCPGKLIQVLVLGAAYEKVADSTCSAATIRRRHR